MLYCSSSFTIQDGTCAPFVIGGRVLASMRRNARQRLAHQRRPGGRAKVAAPTAVEQRLALAAAAAVGAIVAGVDLLPGPDGEYYVLEVNAVPGWRCWRR